MGSRVKQGRRLQKMMKCLCVREPVKGEDETIPSSESLGIREFYSSTASGRSGLDGEIEMLGSDSGKIDETELSLRESGILDNEVGFFKNPLLSSFDDILSHNLDFDVLYFALAYLLQRDPSPLILC